MNHLSKAKLMEECEKNPNIYEALCDFYQISVDDLNALIEDGKIPFNAIEECECKP